MDSKLLEFVKRGRLRAATLGLAALVIGSACAGGAHVPDGAPNGTLSLGEEPEARGEKGAFAIVFGAPRGATVDPPEISLVFNRPMVPLELAENQTAPPVKMTPEVKGRWQWVGTNALSFVPEVRLPRATRVRVEVPQGTKALGGEALEKPYVLEFSTARPSVLRVDPGTDTDHVAPDATLTAWLDQPVDAAELKRATKILAGEKGDEIPFEVKARSADNEQVFVLTPTKKLPLGTDIRVQVAEDLKGKEGPLPSGDTKYFAMRTYGDFAVTDASCDEDAPGKLCSSGGGLWFETTNETKYGDLKKAVTIEPPANLRWSSWMDDDEETQRFQLYGDFKPGRRYTLKVAAGGVKDVYGQVMARDFSKTFEIGDVWATADLGVSGTFVEPGTTSEIPAYVVNARDAELAYAPVSEKDVFYVSGLDGYKLDTFDLVRGMPNGLRKELPAAAAVNTVARHAIKIDDVLGKDGRGPIAVALRYTTRPGTSWGGPRTELSIVQVTDLSISAKISPDGSLVWVTRLSSGAPVAGAKVMLRNKEGTVLVEHTTDKEGFVKIPPSEFVPKQLWEESSVLFVRDGKDWAFRHVSSVLSSWQYGLSWDFEAERAFGLVFSDAGLYRPGDAVHIKGVLREPTARGMKTPGGRTVKLRVDGSDGTTIAEMQRTLSAFGTFDAEVKVPETGRLGTYQIWADLDGAPGGTNATAEFEVAEYRAAEFKVTAETDRPSYVRGDAMTCTARGDYLYGAPMAKAGARVSLTRLESSFWPPVPEGFSAGDGAYSYDLPDAAPARGSLPSSNGALDGKGTTTVKATLAMPGQRGAEAVLCEAEVTDVSRQALAGSTSAIVHPAEFYLAIKTGESAFYDAGDKVTPEVLAVDPKGAKVAGQKVKLELVSRTWTVARQKTGRGSLHRVSTPVDKVVATCGVTTGAQPASCALSAPSAGYFIVRASGEDARKNPIAASVGVYATGEAKTGWRDEDDNRLNLVTDKASYQVGQTAKILIKSPFPSAEALVTVERAGVYTQTRQTLRGSMPSITIPVTEDLRPNAFVSVLLLRGRSKAPPKDPKGADVGAPAFRFGAAQLRVDPEARRLAIKLSPDGTDKRPGQELTVAVDVKDRQNKGARAEVTLYAVDEGVLSLIGYETPDPIRALSEPRPLRVATMESRESLARTFNPYASLGLDKGRDGGDGADKSSTFRRDFRTSAYFHPTLVTDDQGHAVATFKLPESLTTYRLMAVATTTDDRFGFAQSYVTTSRPLMARPALPRFLRAGDALDAGVIVTSKGLAKASIDVEVAAEGLTVKGPAKKTIDLEPGQSTEVRFAMDAPRVGSAKLRFVARGGGDEDRVEVTRKVAAPLSLEAVALYGDTTGQSVEALGDMKAIRDDVGGLTVNTSSSALIGLQAGVEQLIEYPYGCTEQLVSRLVPLIPLRELSRDYGFPLPKNVDPIVLETVGKILEHQRSDGGFGWWTESQESSPWLTAYALWGLNLAEKRGYAVPAVDVMVATKYLAGTIEKAAFDPWMRASIPFMLDVLAERGHPDVGRMNTWFEIRGTLPVFAKADLLHAMAIGKADRAAIDTLATELEQLLRLDGPAAKVVSNYGDQYAALLDSDTRSTALVLRALLAARPQHPMAAKLVRGLLDDRKGGAWRNTQETAWALLALDDYRRAQEKKAPDFAARVFLGQAEVATHDFRGRTLDQATATLPASQVVGSSGAALGFSVDGTGKLFYEARLRYSKREMPKAPIDRGFFVKKTYRVVKPEDLAEVLARAGSTSQVSFAGGDLVLAEVVVVTPTPRENVVVDDPLPAGFEAIDARLATSAASLDVDAVRGGSGDGDGDDEEGDEPSVEDDIAMGRAYFASNFIREVRDDRVLFFVEHMAAGMYRYRYLARATTLGTFVLPPARAEEMYSPEVFGRTAGASITVSAK